MHGHSHPHLPATNDDINPDRYRKIRHVTLIGAIIDVLLGLFKITVGKIAFSQALIADGIHSLSDLVTDGLVIWAAKQASRGPDNKHPYGHQRIETLASIVLGLLLVLVAGGIAYHAIKGILSGEILTTPGILALVIALISVFAKEAIYRYTLKTANQIDSNLLKTNAWHHRSDALSSIVVVIGVGGAIAGLPYLDAVAAILVGVMILYIGGTIVKAGIDELIDTGLGQGELERMRTVMNHVEGVNDVHDLRTRKMGHDILVDVHVMVDRRISVSEGHQIGETARASLKKEFKNASDITVHIDVEDDLQTIHPINLPSRQQLLSQLHTEWRDIPEAKNIDRVTLHYLDNKISIEICLPLSPGKETNDLKILATQLKLAANEIRAINKIDILFH